jgi:hypothetical protein|nr:MAG TPA: hypothetical protein [Caudoviricetes sp.]
MQILNSTGTFWLDDYRCYWSYLTKMTDYFGGEEFKNVTFYSPTTAKHQSKIPYVDFFHQLRDCPYGDWNIEKAIIDETEYCKQQIKDRLQKRKTKQNLEAIKNEVLKRNYLLKLLKNNEE